MATKAIAKQETAVEKWDDINWDDDGTEDVRPAFPIVKMVQAVSTMPGSSKHIGEWHRSDTDEYMQSPLPLGVLAMRRTRAIFEKGQDTPSCRSNDCIAPAPNQPLWEGGEQPATCSACPNSKWVNNEPPPCKMSIVLMADLNVDGDTPEFAQVRLSTSSMKPFEQIVARRIRPKNRRLCQFRFELGSEEVQGGGNKYQKLTVYAEDLPKEKALEYASALRSMRETFDREASNVHENEDGGVEDNGFVDITPAQQAFIDADD